MTPPALLPQELGDGTAAGGALLTDTQMGMLWCGIFALLYFYFHLDAGVMFLVLFLVSIYAWAENHSRNLLRNKCRNFVETWVTNNGSLTTASAGMTLKEWIQHEDGEDKCGYSALNYTPGLSMDPVRRHPTPPWRALVPPPHPLPAPPTPTPISHPTSHPAPYLTLRHP